ncbi:S-adenosyl-L-methionine-dependent methyltransferase [Aspergillus undulatus]|uniref:S-adenosyl-L-methionine-dependent methyltransferase n=1 Tax=Aspergillus undulatus TaxID=1810928 RepID=UPI003CCD938B
MSNDHPGTTIYKTAVSVGSLGFVPIAVRFRVFPILSEFGGAVNGRDVRDAYLRSCSGGTADIPPVRLIEDTLVAMAALDWAHLAGDNMFSPNEATRYLASNQSAIHGILHFTTEVLLGSAFLMRKLEATGFKYPFTELETPIQHAYHLMGNEDLARMHTYAIMAAEGRIASFNTFMQGRFGMDLGVFDRLQSLGYNLACVVQKARDEGVPARMVDIGGGRGDLLLDLKKSIPNLEDHDLIVQEFNSDITNIPGLTLMTWDYSQDNSPQPINGALVYHLAGVLHNLPDLAAARLLQKISAAMAPYSRILIHERLKENIPAANATMVVLYAGRERNIGEWRQLAELAGLRVVFAAFPEGPRLGVVEMRTV